jgi:subfamily B ATP-binding cassette protein MsbA
MNDSPPLRIRERFLAFLRPYRRLAVVAMVGNFTTVFVVMLMPLALKLIIDEVIPSRNLALLLAIGAVFVALKFIQYTVGYSHVYIQYYVGQRMVFDIRKALFHHLQVLHLAFYEKEKTASLVNRVIHDVGTVQQFMNQAFSTITNASVAFVISLGLMLYLNWKLTVMCLLVLPLLYIVRRSFQTILYRKSHDVRERQSAFAGMLGETFSGIKVVKSFAQEDYENRRFVLTMKDNFYPEFELTMVGHRLWLWVGSLCDLTYTAVLVFGGWAVIQNHMTIGDFVAFTGYLSYLIGPVQSLANLIQASSNARAGFERILNLLDTHPKVVEVHDPVVLPNIKGQVTFDHVHFQYSELPTIRDFHLDVQPGEVIALVGPSGSGKSTIVSLLTRFYDVESGAIRVDGVDLRKLDYDCYRRQIGIVLQDSFLFSGTIEENIRYGKPDATTEEIREVAHQANALEFIEKIPDGFHSRVGPNGVTLSGGQRQRIAIARAILKNPRILIFDEATSALDNESEALIQDSLSRLMKGKTVFVVAHRLTTVQKANRLVVLENGLIVETGSHSELLALNGLYTRLYQPRLLAFPAQHQAA